jgi:hypothetical protein
MSYRGSLGRSIVGAAAALGLTLAISGIGGQMDFVRGASLARDGRAIICLPSTARSLLIGDLPTALWWATADAPPLHGAAQQESSDVGAGNREHQPDRSKCPHGRIRGMGAEEIATADHQHEAHADVHHRDDRNQERRFDRSTTLVHPDTSLHARPRFPNDRRGA